VNRSGNPITADLDAFSIELAPNLLDAVHAGVGAVHAAISTFGRGSLRSRADGGREMARAVALSVAATVPRGSVQ
jgi:hypothetical protein